MRVEDIDSDNTPIRRCPICNKHVDTYLDERAIDYMPNDKANPKTGHYHTEWVDALWCSECDEYIEDVKYLK